MPSELGDNGEMFLQAGKWEASSCLSKLVFCIVSDNPPTIHTMAGAWPSLKQPGKIILQPTGEKSNLSPPGWLAPDIVPPFDIFSELN